MLTKKKIIRRPRAERIEEICRAAREAFAAHGYEQALIADIAAAAGVAEGTIYKLFDSKRELLCTVIDEWYRGFIGQLERALNGIADPQQKLRYVIWHHLKIIEENPALCRLFFREIRADHDYRGSAMFELNRDYTAFVLDVIREGVASGAFRGDVQAAMVRDAIYGGLEHYVWQYLSEGKPLDVDTSTDQFWRFVVAGIAAPGPRCGAGDQQIGSLVERLEAVTARLEQNQASKA